MPGQVGQVHLNELMPGNISQADHVHEVCPVGIVNRPVVFVLVVHLQPGEHRVPPVQAVDPVCRSSLDLLAQGYRGIRISVAQNDLRKAGADPVLSGVPVGLNHGGAEGVRPSDGPGGIVVDHHPDALFDPFHGQRGRGKQVTDRVEDDTRQPMGNLPPEITG